MQLDNNKNKKCIGTHHNHHGTPIVVIASIIVASATVEFRLFAYDILCQTANDELKEIMNYS